MSLSEFNNTVIDLGKSVKRSKVRSIRKLTRQIESFRKKDPDDERTKRKVNRIIEEIHQIRKLLCKDVVLFAMEHEGTIAEILQKCKPPSDDLKQHALIRLATEKSLQAEIIALKNSDLYAKSWQQLLIMYQSRYEKRLVWKEKSKDFEKIEEALAKQQKELEEIEHKLPKPLKVKKKKEKQKKGITHSKQAVVCVLDLENKTVEPFGNEVDEDDNEQEKEEEEDVVELKPKPKEKKLVEESEAMETDSKQTSSSTAVINDPFFLNSQHQITYQKRTSRNKDDADLDDKTFIEHSYFVNALSSSSNRRDGGGEVAKRKWAHLKPPPRPRPSNKSSAPSNGTVKEPIDNQKSQKQDPNSGNLHPSWEASKQAKSQYSIKKSEAKKVVFNDSDDDNS